MALLDLRREHYGQVAHDGESSPYLRKVTAGPNREPVLYFYERPVWSFVTFFSSMRASTIGLTCASR